MEIDTTQKKSKGLWKKIFRSGKPPTSPSSNSDGSLTPTTPTTPGTPGASGSFDVSSSYTRIYSGWLYKQSKKTPAPKKYFFVIKPEVLEYYRSEMDADPKRVYSLRFAAVDKEGANGIKILLSNNAAVVLFTCDNSSEPISESNGSKSIGNSASTWTAILKQTINCLTLPKNSISPKGSHNSTFSPRFAGAQKVERRYLVKGPGTRLFQNSAGLNSEEEEDVALAATTIFMKTQDQLNAEEKAYKYALAEYHNLIKQYQQFYKCLPVHGLASGTVSFVSRPDERSEPEQQYITAMGGFYIQQLQKMAESMNISYEDQIEVVQRAIQIFNKSEPQRTDEEQEYVNYVEEYLIELYKAELLCGTKAKHTLISGLTNFAKFEEERTELDHQYLQEIYKL